MNHEPSNVPVPMLLGIYRLTTYAVAACALHLAACSRPSAADPEKHARPTVSAVPVASARAAAQPAASSGVFEISGVAAAARTATLASKGQGVLRSIKVREGDRVKAGDVLAVLDTTDLTIRSQSAQVAHAQALAALDNARDDIGRANQLFDAGALPDQAMEKAKIGLRIAELQVQAAQVGVRMAQQALADATLRAPFDGVVTKVLAEEGNYITVMPPSPIFVLSDTDTLEVRGAVPERRLSMIRKGMPVVVSLPAIGVTRDARVDRLSDVVDPMTRSIDIVVRLDNKDHAMPAGLFARVSFPSIPGDASDAAGALPAAFAPKPVGSGEAAGR